MSNRKNKIQKGYKTNSNRYDDYITSRKIWSKLLVKIIWGMRDEEYVKTIIPLLDNDFNGKILDIPVGTAVFTYKKYHQMSNAEIICMDYSQEMLNYAKEKFEYIKAKNIKCLQGDIDSLPFENETFDIVLSMNGFHAFPNKEKAFDEIYRVLKPNGKFIGCFYIKQERKFTDFFIKKVFVRNGTFSPQFMNKEELNQKLKEHYRSINLWNVKSIACFQCLKKN